MAAGAVLDHALQALLTCLLPTASQRPGSLWFCFCNCVFLIASHVHYTFHFASSSLHLFNRSWFSSPVSICSPRCPSRTLHLFFGYTYLISHAYKDRTHALSSAALTLSFPFCSLTRNTPQSQTANCTSELLASHANRAVHYRPR